MRLYAVVLSCCIGFLSLSQPAYAFQKTTVAVLIKGLSNPYWQALSEGARDAALENGIPMLIQGPQTDQDAEGQLNICQTLILQSPQVLIFAPVNGTNLIPCLKRAQEKGIKLVDIDGGYTRTQAEDKSLNISFSVASNNYDLGKQAAQYLKGKKGNVLVLEGLAGNTPGQLRLKGFQDNLPKGLKIVASQPGDWDRLKAATITNDVLLQHPDIKAIFAANDMMALGAAEAVHAKKKKGVTIVGIDGVTDAVKAIKAGRLSASIAQLPYLMGKNAIEKSNPSVQYVRALDYEQYVPALTLDKAVLKANKDPLLRYLK